jgi:glycosyltransferase involved in cell wall biosynthesis
MKVLWFSNSPAAAYSDKLKGTGGWIMSLDKALQQRVELHVAYHYPYREDPFQKGKTWYHPIYKGNIITENLKQRFFPYYHKDLVDVYLKIVDDVKPDIIHIHGSENVYHRIAERTNIPIVLSIQGNPTVISQKFLSGFHGKYLYTKIGKIGFQTFVFGRSSFGSELRSLIWLSHIEQIDLPKIHNVIGRTDWDRRITRIFAPNSRYFVSNEALRDSFYQNKWYKEAPQDKIIIHTTNGNNYYKGFETLCYALHLLNQIDVNVEWRVAGVSEKSEINKITRKFLGNNYPQKGLVLMGSLDEKGLLDSLITSHLYVMPSHIENSPNNLCEAMLLGMPCITTHAGGSDSILINKKEGLVIQDGDPWSMAGAILELKNDWTTAILYGKQAREHALKRHDRDKIVDDLIETYRTIIEENHKS